MKSTINWFCFVILVVHSLYISNVDNLAIFEWGFDSIKQSYDTILGNSNVFDNDLNWLLPIFIKNFKFVTEIIENPTMSSTEVSANKSYIVFPALFIKLILIIQAHLGYEHQIVSFNYLFWDVLQRECVHFDISI